MSKVSISFVKGRGSMAHNNREFVTQNVDEKRISDNITYRKETLAEAYEKCFGDAIEKYNSKQKRSDRKIDGSKAYMEKIKNSKNGENLFYENVVQVGNMHDCNVGTEQGEKAKKVLDDYMKGFEERNPNLYVFNAVLHLDEQTPHLHIDYIPVASGYQRGMNIRNSLTKALKQQGIDTKSGHRGNKFDNRTIAWQSREKDHIEKILLEHGLERAEEKGIKGEHRSVAFYKAMVNEIDNQVNVLPEQIHKKETLSLFGKSEKVTVAKSDLELLERRAKLSTVHQKANEELAGQVKEIRTNVVNYALEKEMIISSSYDLAQKEREMAKEILDDANKKRAEAVSLFKQQKGLIEKYNNLVEKSNGLVQKVNQQNSEIKELKQTVKTLERDKSDLKAQISDLRDSIQERVQKSVIKLKTELQLSRRAFNRVCEKLTDVTKAFNMLKHDNSEGYGLDLSKKQSRLFEAIEKDTTEYLRDVGQDELATEIEKKIGISTDIRDSIKSLEPKRNRGMER